MYRNCTATRLRTPTTFSVHYYIVKVTAGRRSSSQDSNVCIFFFTYLQKGEQGGGVGPGAALGPKV